MPAFRDRRTRDGTGEMPTSRSRPPQPRKKPAWLPTHRHLYVGGRLQRSGPKMSSEQLARAVKLVRNETRWARRVNGFFVDLDTLSIDQLKRLQVWRGDDPWPPLRDAGIDWDWRRKEAIRRATYDQIQARSVHTSDERWAKLNSNRIDEISQLKG